jgi:hypothetical protein
MPTLTQTRPKIRSKRLESVPVVFNHPAEPPDIEDVTAEYPPAFIEYLDRIYEETKKGFASGKLKSMTDAEIAVAIGLKL